MAQWRTKGLLLISSLLNAAICYFTFWFMVFATSPHMDDVTMRIGFYVVNVISVSAFAAIFVPWILAHRNQNKIAAFFAMLPVLLICLAILAFLTLDSWLSRTFSSLGAPASMSGGRLYFREGPRVMVLDPDIIRTTIAEIEAAFSGLRPPDDAHLLHPQCMDDGDIVDFYGPLERRQLSDDSIIRNYAAPSFFSAEAFQYYMPAFMIWSLNHYDTIEYAPESTIRAFDPTNEKPGLYEFQVSKFALFTERQRASVIRFLQAFSPDPDLGPIARDALTNYWLRQNPVST